jgi:hypothetical protein
MCAPISTICSTYDGPVTRAGALLAGLLLALSVAVGLVPPAGAATRTVHLTNDGPRPVSLTLHAGDAVQFVNDDTVPHQVRSDGAWQYDSGPLPPTQTSAPTPRLTAPGTYRYFDVRGIVFLPQTFTGSLVVPAPAARPTATSRPTSRPTATPSSAPPSSAASPSASPAPGAGSGSPPVLPSLSPLPSATAVLPALPSASPLPTASPVVPAPVRYGEPRALVQNSPHRYGLPAVLAGLAIGGVLSLLGRYLLAQPEGRRT